MILAVKTRTDSVQLACAEENNGVQVFEGNWYFTPEKVNMEHLRVTERTYTCPYKGVCLWIDLEQPDGHISRNIAWVYSDPKPGYEFIKDKIAFYARTTAGTITEQAP